MSLSPSEEDASSLAILSSRGRLIMSGHSHVVPVVAGDPMASKGQRPIVNFPSAQGRPTTVGRMLPQRSDSGRGLRSPEQGWPQPGWSAHGAGGSRASIQWSQRHGCPQMGSAAPRVGDEEGSEDTAQDLLTPSGSSLSVLCLLMGP